MRLRFILLVWHRCSPFPLFPRTEPPLPSSSSSTTYMEGFTAFQSQDGEESSASGEVWSRASSCADVAQDREARKSLCYIGPLARIKGLEAELRDAIRAVDKAARAAEQLEDFELRRSILDIAAIASSACRSMDNPNNIGLSEVISSRERKLSLAYDKRDDTIATLQDRIVDLETDLQAAQDGGKKMLEHEQAKHAARLLARSRAKVEPHRSYAIATLEFEGEDALWGGVYCSEKAARRSTEIALGVCRTAWERLGGFKAPTLCHGGRCVAMFETIEAGVDFCLEVQNGLHNAPWPEDITELPPGHATTAPFATQKTAAGSPLFNGLRMRCGLGYGAVRAVATPISNCAQEISHHGEASRCSAQLCSMAHGGEILITKTVHDMLGSGGQSFAATRRLQSSVLAKESGRVATSHPCLGRAEPVVSIAPPELFARLSRFVQDEGSSSHKIANLRRLSAWKSCVDLDARAADEDTWQGRFHAERSAKVAEVERNARNTARLEGVLANFRRNIGHMMGSLGYSAQEAQAALKMGQQNLQRPSENLEYDSDSDDTAVSSPASTDIDAARAPLVQKVRTKPPKDFFLSFQARHIDSNVVMTYLKKIGPQRSGGVRAQTTRTVRDVWVDGFKSIEWLRAAFTPTEPQSQPHTPRANRRMSTSVMGSQRENPPHTTSLRRQSTARPTAIPQRGSKPRVSAIRIRDREREREVTLSTPRTPRTPISSDLPILLQSSNSFTSPLRSTETSHQSTQASPLLNTVTTQTERPEVNPITAVQIGAGNARFGDAFGALTAMCAIPNPIPPLKISLVEHTVSTINPLSHTPPPQQTAPPPPTDTTPSQREIWLKTQFLSLCSTLRDAVAALKRVAALRKGSLVTLQETLGLPLPDEKQCMVPENHRDTTECPALLAAIAFLETHGEMGENVAYPPSAPERASPPTEEWVVRNLAEICQICDDSLVKLYQLGPGLLLLPGDVVALKVATCGRVWAAVKKFHSEVRHLDVGPDWYSGTSPWEGLAALERCIEAEGGTPQQTAFRSILRSWHSSFAFAEALSCHINGATPNAPASNLRALLCRKKVGGEKEGRVREGPDRMSAILGRYQLMNTWLASDAGLRRRWEAMKGGGFSTPVAVVLQPPRR